MNRVLRFLNGLEPMRLYHFLIFIIFLSSLYAGAIYKLPITMVALFNVIYRNKTVEKWSVVFYALNFIGLAYSSYYWLANHLLLLGIFSFYVVYRVWLDDKKWNFPYYLIALIISVATLQKLGSSYFLQGNLMGQFMHNDTGIKYVGELLDPNYAINSKDFITNYYQLTHTGKGFDFKTTPALSNFSKIFTWVILVSEIALSLAIIFLKVKWKYICLLVFLIMTSITRSEFGFFSILIIISLFDTQLKDKKVRSYYKYVLPFFVIGFFNAHIERYIYFLETRL